MSEEIYTKEFVIKELKVLLQELKKHTEYVYLGELFTNKSYSRQRFSEWLKDYGDDEEIREYSDTIKEILETRVVSGAISNKLNATISIFHLKNNYKWVDRQEIEQKNTNFDIDVSKLSNEELKGLIK